MNKISILCVEDNSADMSRIKEYLSEKPPFRYDMMEADSLRAALSLLSHHDFDVVLLNLGLPDSSGLDTARRVITEYSDTAVIVLSTPENEQVAQQTVRYGAEDYLEKHLLSPAVVQKAITYAIGRKKLLQEKHDILSDLVLALEKIECLEGLLPICVGCKKIRHENNHWLDLEEFANQFSSRRVARPICPDCNESLKIHL